MKDKSMPLLFIAAIMAAGLAIYALHYQYKKEKSGEDNRIVNVQAGKLDKTHLAGNMYVFVVDGHEYLENLFSFGGGFFDSGSLSNTIVHTESCPCHEGRKAIVPEVWEYHAEELYEGVWKLTYNGHDYLSITPFGNALVHMASCPCLTPENLKTTNTKAL